MKKYFFVGLGLMLLSLLIGLVVIWSITPLYRVSAQVIISKSLISPTGLMKKESLLSDDFLKRLLDEDQELKHRLAAFKESLHHRHSLPEEYAKKVQQSSNVSHLFFQEIRKQIRIDYSGGNHNAIRIKVEDKNPLLAHLMVEKVVEELKNSKRKLTSSILEKQLQFLHQKMMELEKIKEYSSRTSPISPQQQLLLAEQIQQLRQVHSQLYVENLLREVENPQSIQVIENPFLPLHPIWPKRTLLMIISFMVGLLGWGTLLLIGLKRS